MNTVLRFSFHLLPAWRRPHNDFCRDILNLLFLNQQTTIVLFVEAHCNTIIWNFKIKLNVSRINTIFLIIDNKMEWGCKIVSIIIKVIVVYMYTENNRVPGTGPCGTPVSIITGWSNNLPPFIQITTQELQGNITTADKF